MINIKFGLLAFVSLVTASAGLARAEDVVNIANGQREAWENSISELGQKAGIFKKHGLSLNIFYTQGSGETLQTTLSGAMDVGIGVGTHGVLGAMSKGAPVRIIGASFTGVDDLYYYVDAKSSVKTLAEANGRSMGVSGNGSASHIIALGLQKQLGLAFKTIVTGTHASTYTQVMTGQVYIGFATAPLLLDKVAEGTIRIIGRASEAPRFKFQTTRSLIANAGFVEAKTDIVARFIRAYAETVEWYYSDPDAIKAYAAWVNLPVDVAARAPKEFQKKENLAPRNLSGLNEIIADAIEFKYIPGVPDAATLAKLVAIPPG